MKSLAAGVPMLCMPISREQPENAAHVEWLGAGLRLEAGAASDAIRTVLTRLLDEDGFRSKARETSVRLRAEIAEDIAVRELEQVVGSRPVHVARH
jgi:UDP:flavonoid glycosyltransferase YjiC (YdhE family)